MITGCHKAVSFLGTMGQSSHLDVCSQVLLVFGACLALAAAQIDIGNLPSAGQCNLATLSACVGAPGTVLLGRRRGRVRVHRPVRE